MGKNGFNFALLLAFAAVIAAGVAHAVVLSGPSLNASLLYYQPVPASPGSLLDVYVQVYNSGEAARNVNVRFVDNAPFSLGNEADRVKTIESIPGQNSFLLHYQVRVSQDAVPGISYMRLEYSAGGGQSQTSMLPMSIYSTTVSLNVQNISVQPEYIAPGSVGTVSFQLYNAAPLRVRDGTVTLDLSNLDVVPVGGTNQQRFTALNPGDLQQFSFQIAPSPNIVPGTYKLPVILNFSDQQGRAYQRTEVIGVRIGAKPDITVNIDSSKITAEQKSGDVIIRVTNKGLGEVKFVDLTLGKSDTFELTSNSNEQYVGNIDSDDYKTASVSLEAKNDLVQIPVTVTYMDALNTPYSKNMTLTLQARPNASKGVSGWLIVGVGIIIAVAGYFIFRRRKVR
jgi:hypothetical protein